MRQLIPLFFHPKQLQANNSNKNSGSGGVVARNMLGGIRRLWEISSSTVLAACTEAYKISSTLEDRRDTVSYQCTMLREALLTASNKPNDWKEVVTLSKDPEFALIMAAHMADNNMLDFPTFLSDQINSLGMNVMAMQTVLIISRMHKHAKARREGLGSDGTVSLILSLENLAALLRLLTSFNAEALGQVVPNTDMTCAQQGKWLLDRCMQMFPNLAIMPANSPSPDSQFGEIEDQANSYFQKIYQSEESAREVVGMMKKLKASRTSRENDIFACMIHNLFDEYQFFSKYPEKELRITGILFGLLIKEQLVSSITLGIALRYVLEALRKHPNLSVQSGKMFRFGMFALEQFKERLPEWPQYCSHIVQIGHLREGYAALVGEIETGMAMEDS
jgi:CCR4-NOT transcription complex subunit 1